MSTNRALFWKEHIGGHQYRLRIRDTNPGNNKQWFVFDWRTRSIRTQADRNKVISIQNGGKNWFYYHYAAVVKKYTGSSLQKIRWFRGSRMNIRDIGLRCLDVHGGSNSNNRHVHWYKCHKKLNQAWYIDQKGVTYPKQPLASGVRFQIRSRMKEHRAVYIGQNMGSGQRYLRIQDHNPDNKDQWWTFDARSNTIRAFYKRSQCISPRKGYGFRPGQYASVRQYIGDNTNKIQWHSGSRRNIRNNGYKCLDAQSNYHTRYVYYQNCNNNLKQAWFIDQKARSYQRQPLPDGRKFQIRSRMSGGKALSYHQHIGSYNYALKIQNFSPWEENQWFVFDSRTKSIRSFKKRNYAIANRYNYQHRPRQYAVIRPWKNDPYQKITFRGRALINHASICLSVRSKRNTHRQLVTFEPCVRQAHQQWYPDTQGVKFPRYPLKDGVKFQIKSMMKTNRALFVKEHIGSHQYRLRIRDNAPENIKQWFTFDWRTRSIRSAANRKQVISIQYNGKNWNYFHYAAVVRNYKADNLQKIRWFNGSRRNIRDLGRRCLDVHGNSNSNNRHVHWYKCHNGLNQGWTLDTKGVNYPPYPIKDGVKFQIKTKMNSKRPISWHSNNYAYLMDNNPYNSRQWFVFDSRTKTIRPASRRNWVVYATHLRHNAYARFISYRKDSKNLMRWYDGSRRNLRTIRSLCMALQSRLDRNMRHIMFYNCHSGLDQAWWVDQNGPLFRNQPFSNGVKFQIKSRRAGHKALFMSYQGSGYSGYYLRQRSTLPGDERQWFSFDRRTRSIRSTFKKNYAISNQYNNKFKVDNYAVIRPWRKENYQKMSYYPGKVRNIRSPAGYCLDNMNTRWNSGYMKFRICNNNANQSYFLDRRPLHYPRYPLRDGIKFQIKSRMATNRALFWKEHIGSYQYRLRIRNNNPGNNRQWFTFDWRTRSIRAFADRRKAVSAQIGTRMVQNGKAAVVRQFKSESLQRMRFYGGSRKNIRNVFEKCLDVHGASNSNNRHVIWHKCHNGLNQGWMIDRVGYSYPAYPLASGVKFQIKSRMPSNRALYHAEHIGGHQYRLRIRDNNPENNKQWWTFDDRTKTIRAWSRRSYALSNRRGYKYRINAIANIRQWRNEYYQKTKWIGGKYRNIQNLGRKCLDVHGGSNTNKRHVIFYNCHNGLNQAWYIDQKGISYPRQPWGDSVRFQIRSKMSGGKALFYKEHIGSSQYQLRIRYNMPGEGKQWFIFNKRTRTIRSAEKRSYAIANRLGRGYNVGQSAVIRPYRGEIYQKIAYYGGKFRNIRNNAQKCLDVHGKSNTNNRHVIFWNCHNGANQGWFLDRHGVRYPRQPYRDGVKFQIRSRMPKKRTLAVGTHIGGQQYAL